MSYCRYSEKDYTPEFCKTNQCSKCKRIEKKNAFFNRILSITEINYLSKCRRFIIPAKQYGLFSILFFSRRYSSWRKNWKLSLKSGEKQFPKQTKLYFKYSELLKKYGSRYGIPTNKDWVIDYDK